MIYDISYKTLIGAKPLSIRFNKVAGFIRVLFYFILFFLFYIILLYLYLYFILYIYIYFIYNNILYYYILFYTIHDKIRYLISQKRDIDSYDPLPLEKTLTLHNVIKLFKSVFNKDQNHYYYNLFSEKCSYKQYKYAML